MWWSTPISSVASCALLPGRWRDASTIPTALFGRRGWPMDESFWLVRTKEGRYDPNPKVMAACEEVRQILRALPIPALVIEQGLPEILIATPELWAQQGRVISGLRDAKGRFIDLHQTSAAVAPGGSTSWFSWPWTSGCARQRPQARL